MNDETTALIDSLQAVSSHAQSIADALKSNTMTPKKQHEYADMLMELSSLLHEHATIQEMPGTATEGRHSLRPKPPSI